MAIRQALFVRVALLVFSLGVAATSVAESPRVRIGSSGDYPPFSEALGDEDAPFETRGLDAALATRWAEARGIEIEWVRFQWPNLLNDLAAGRFDVAMSGVTVRPERSARGHYTIATVETGAVALVRDAQRHSRVALLNRPGVRIGVNAGGHLEHVALANFPKATVLAIPDNASVREALVSEAVDAVVTETHEARLWRAAAPESEPLGPLSHDRKAWLVRAGNQALAADLDRWLLEREADGSLARLREEHLGVAGVATAEPLRALMAAIDERLSLMPLVGTVKRASGVPLEVPEREQVVLDAATKAVLEAAARAEVSPPDTEDVLRFFRAQMEAAKEVQWKAVQDVDNKPEPPYPDLDGMLRPSLLVIGERIARLIVMLPPETSESRIRAVAKEELRTSYLGGASKRALADAVARLVPSAAESPDPEPAQEMP
jgi:cyclohexadienyl dehydratase